MGSHTLSHGVLGALSLLAVMVGACQTLLLKVLFSVGFERPWFLLLLMFSGMSTVCLLNPPCCKNDEDDIEGERRPLFEVPVNPVLKMLAIAFVSALDLAATVTFSFALMSLPASVWQMLRGATIIFTAVFSAVLRRKLSLRIWTAVSLSACGIGLVGYAEVLADSELHDRAHQHGTKGLFLSILGSFISGVWAVLEEYCAKDLRTDPYLLTTLEGVFGIALTAMVVLPALHNVPTLNAMFDENFFVSLKILREDRHILTFATTYMLSCGAWSVVRAFVTVHVSATYSQILIAMRTAVVWAFGLFVYYYEDKSAKFGEPWTKYSVIQLGGFLTLLLGQGVYSEFFGPVRVPEEIKRSFGISSPVSSPASRPH